MQQPEFGTAALWRNWMFLVKFILLSVILGFMALLLEDEIRDFLAGPKYSKDELVEMAKSRKTNQQEERLDNWDLVENGIHVKTGLKADENVNLIIASCTSCHSAKIITQNRTSRQGWKDIIDWMQETQGLVELGHKESPILDYLAKYYAPQEVGRRANLDVAEIEWYILNLNQDE